jgi:hypothetical protein
LALFNVDIRHKLGKENIVPDALSRNDALPSLGVNPLEGSPKCNCGKRDSEGCSRLPAL